MQTQPYTPRIATFGSFQGSAFKNPHSTANWAMSLSKVKQLRSLVSVCQDFMGIYEWWLGATISHSLLVLSICSRKCYLIVYFHTLLAGYVMLFLHSFSCLAILTLLSSYHPSLHIYNSYSLLWNLKYVVSVVFRKLVSRIKLAYCWGSF